MKIGTFVLSALALPFLFFSTHLTFAQPCVTASAQIDLEANNVKARHQASGTLWWDSADGKYLVPKDRDVSAIFAGNFWMGGYADNGILHLAAQEYGVASGNNDYWAGPLDDDGLTNFETCNEWDRFFVVTREEIDAHRADWSDNGIIDNAVPENILGWPGKGNPSFLSINGFELIESSSGLAPFFDQNNNGVYEPMQGDYPLVKGDDSIWWVFNDQGGGAPHANSGGVRLKMEIQGNAFAFEDENEVVDNTTFYDFKFIFKGNFPLNDFYLSLWIDPDFGCPVDDYFGCIPEEELAFIYNADDFDENCFPNINGYEADIPLLGIKIIESYAPGNSVSTGMSKFTYINNASVSNPPPATGDPQSPEDYHNRMKGLWLDGEALSSGGNGYNPGADPYDFAFDGNPADDDEWSLCASDNEEFDRRILMSFGPYHLNPGDVGTLSFAVVTLPSVEYPCPDVTPLVEAANDMVDFYKEQCEELLSYTMELTANGMVGVFPNPSADFISFKVNRSNLVLENIQLYSVDGKLMKDTGMIFGQTSIVNVDELSSGVYLYRAVLNNGKLATGRIVVED